MVGATKAVVVSPTDGYGIYDSKLRFEVPTSKLGSDLPPVDAMAFLELDKLTPEPLCYSRASARPCRPGRPRASTWSGWPRIPLWPGGTILTRGSDGPRWPYGPANKDQSSLFSHHSLTRFKDYQAVFP